MALERPRWIVVTDFDGTLTKADVGNLLCEEILGDRFFDIHDRYRAGTLGLKEMQRLLWQDFPLAETRFRQKAAEYGELREGAIEFLERCQRLDIPVFVASCGLRPYIEPVLEAKLPAALRASIREIRCNEARFNTQGISEFLPPLTRNDCPYPLDKGAWSAELRARMPEGTRILGIGNGTSDRSFAGHVHELAATDALQRWCAQNQVPHLPFDTFFEVIDGAEAFST